MASKLGQKIVTLRNAHHISQQDLADRCDCDVEVMYGGQPLYYYLLSVE